MWNSIVLEASMLKVKSSRGKHNARAVKARSRFRRKYPTDITTVHNWKIEVIFKHPKS
jgi:hypothetical protein